MGRVLEKSGVGIFRRKKQSSGISVRYETQAPVSNAGKLQCAEKLLSNQPLSQEKGIYYKIVLKIRCFKCIGITHYVISGL